LNKARETRKAQKAECEKRLKDSKNSAISVPKIEDFIRDIQYKLPFLDFEGKRLALDVPDITIWIDGENVEATGIADPGIVLTPSYADTHFL
jgi:hypothetical protein